MNTKVLKILYVEDDTANQKDLKDLLSVYTINGYNVKVECESDFERALQRSKEYNLVILDRYEGVATQGGKDVGSSVFDSVKNSFFVPVIFYSGCVNDILDRKSPVVGVASKGESFDVLLEEIKRLCKHSIPFLKNNILDQIEIEFKKYFWDVIQMENDKFTPDADDYSLGYMLLRNFADSLSKENIKKIIGDDSIKDDMVHPMEFYIYPIDSSKEYENGEVLMKKDGVDDLYIILTPSCDFVNRTGRKRKVGNVLLAKAELLELTNEYKEYMKVNDLQKEIKEINQKIEDTNQANSDEEQRLNNEKNKKLQKINSITSAFKQFINSGKSDRYFFLPGTPFIKNSVIDFQNTDMVDYLTLNKDFKRIAKLDSPYVQAMMASFIRYYNRIGFPDIDSNYVISNLKL